MVFQQRGNKNITIMRDVSSGWLIRYTHANVASFFFIFVYLHIGRNLYYGSYRSPRVLPYSIGVVILILMMGIGFLGYIYSPKWFNNINYYLITVVFYFIILLKKQIHYILQIIWKIKTNKNLKIKKPLNNTIKKIKYNKLNIKSICHLNSLNKNYLNKRIYNTSAHVSLRFLRTCPAYARQCISGGSVATQVGGQYLLNNDSEYLECLPVKVSERLNTILEEIGINPVYIFENLNLENIRKQILIETKGLSGIYMIINKVTTDYYIGSASTNKLYARFSNHLIYFRGSKIVKLAVKKYNLKNFAFIVLELYPNIVTKENNKELLDLEDKYLKLLLPNYNILTEAGSSFGYKHTEVTRQKMIDVYSDARREIIGNLNKGKNFSRETIEKMREKALNRSSMSQEIRKKCISNTRPVILYNLNGTVFGQFSTILEAAKSINCNEKTIRRALKTEKRLVKRQ